MKLKMFLKSFKGHNPEADLKIEISDSNNFFSVSSKSVCTHCEKEVILTLGNKNKGEVT